MTGRTRDVPSAQVTPVASETAPPASRGGGHNTVLRVRDLSVEFGRKGQGTLGVHGMSLDLAEGEIVSLVGESGSGKTVTGLAMMGLLDPIFSRIRAGRIELRESDGTWLDVSAMSERRMRTIRGAEISMIFQDPLTSLNPIMSIGEQVIEAARSHKRLTRSRARADARSLFSEVGLGDSDRMLDSYPHQLSGGMRQRVMIAVALASDPRVLIADEPTTALDVTVQAQVVRLLRGLANSRGLAVLFVTHDLALASDIGDVVNVMYAGEIVESGPAGQIFRRPRHPYTAALLACIPNAAARSSLKPISGQPPEISSVLGQCRFAARCGYRKDDCVRATIPISTIDTGHLVRCIRAKDITL